MVRLGLSIAAVVFLLDQVSKWWIVERLMQPPRVIEVTPFFNLVMSWNRGVSFGLFNTDSPWNAYVFTALAVVISMVLVVWMRRAAHWAGVAAFGLIIGGALGNAADRLRWGAVADFLDFHFAGYHFWAFNIADSAITIGAVLLIAESLFEGRRAPQVK